MLQIPCFSPQSSEPRWPEGGARGKNWQEDRWVAREQVDETSTKKTKLVKKINISGWNQVSRERLLQVLLP